MRLCFIGIILEYIYCFSYKLFMKLITGQQIHEARFLTFKTMVFLIVFLMVITQKHSNFLNAVGNMWCVARFAISHYLAFVWLFERMRMHAHAFFYLPVVSIRLYELAWRSNGSIKSQTLECQSNGLGA